MSRVVYSLRIFSADLVPASAPVGPLVPAGLIYVLRDIDVVYHGSTVGDQMFVFNQTTGILVAFSFLSSGQPISQSWRGRQVYATGEQVGFRSFGGTWSVAASGYQLTLP